MDLAAIRSDYTGKDISYLPIEPHRGIELWLEEALKVEHEATAFSLATHAGNALSVRVVLAKNISQAGLTFYTNGASLKGDQLAESHAAAGVFFWPNLHRQVRFEGKVSPVSVADADAYFASRPHESQVAAMVSQQSKPIESYDKLRDEFEQAKKDFAGKAIPRPTHWGGYLITFERVEFWQGQPNRLHQRLLYTRTADAYERVWLQP
jgi:pyridoxamine 5'-phosphate oxidase